MRAGLTPFSLSGAPPGFKPERLSQTVPCVGDSHRPRPVANDNLTQMVETFDETYCETLGDTDETIGET